MLRAKEQPKFLWAEAVSNAVYVLNRTTHSSRRNLKTAYEVWKNRKPNLEHIRVFGSTAYIHVPKQLRRKLDDKAKKMILVGYQGESSNYRLYDPDNRKVSVSRDVVFHEHPKLPDTSERKLVLPNTARGVDEIIEIDDDEDVAEAETRDNERVDVVGIDGVGEEAPGAEGRVLRVHELPRGPHRYISEIDYSEYKPPETYQEAASGPESEKWVIAINDELQALEKNQTWVVVKKKEDMKSLIQNGSSRSCARKQAINRDTKRDCAQRIFANSMESTIMRRSLS